MASTMNGSEKFTVKAIYKFKASNNDELSLKKGEIIIVTQREDGGWWEGTSRETGKTGWFPSNYVSEIKDSSPISETGSSPGAVIDPTTAAELLAQQIENRQQVIRDLVDKENEFVDELQALFTSYLEPLSRADIMPPFDYKFLVGNIEEMMQVHRNLAAALEEEAPPKKSPREQRIGKILLTSGATIKSAHMTYWANHPKAVSVLERFRSSLDKFMDNQGAPSPGLMTLTTGLSKPFRQLERYASVSQELEQHLEDDHVDRGDCQRSIGFYKNIAADCAKQRRQKELELEILTGTIREWEGEELASLGDILHVGSVTVGADHKDRYFVLFPNTLLILSVSTRMSGFIYEGKLPLSGIAVNRLEDTDAVKNSFEITGPMIDRILVSCITRTESLRWVEILRQQIKCARTSSMVSAAGNSVQGQQNHLPMPPPHKIVSGPPPPSSSPNVTPQKQPKGPTQLWKMSCLRPAPPSRICLIQTESSSGGSKRNSISSKNSLITKKDPETTYEEDMQILRVIEAYCSLSSTSKQRHTFSTSKFDQQFYLSPARRTPLREDSVCKLLEHSCDSFLSDEDIDDEEDEEIELLVEEGQVPVFLQRQKSAQSEAKATVIRDLDLYFDDEDSISNRDSFQLGAGCLPCTPKSSKKALNKCKIHGTTTSNWCCGVVATTVKKTTKKL